MLRPVVSMSPEEGNLLVSGIACSRCQRALLLSLLASHSVGHGLHGADAARLCHAGRTSRELRGSCSATWWGKARTLLGRRPWPTQSG
eukprot:748837-Hanusia_phi.AAC.3